MCRSLDAVVPEQKPSYRSENSHKTRKHLPALLGAGGVDEEALEDALEAGGIAVVVTGGVAVTLAGAVALETALPDIWQKTSTRSAIDQPCCAWLYNSAAQVVDAYPGIQHLRSEAGLHISIQSATTAGCL